MNATIKRTDLKNHLVLVKPGLRRKPTLPIMDAVRIDADPAGLTLTTSNLEQWYTTRVSASGMGEASALVYGKSFCDAVASMAGKEVALSLNGSVKLTDGGVMLDLPTMPVADYPAVPCVGDELFELSEAQINQLASVAWAIDEKDVRPVLTGVFLTVSKGTLEVVATDGFQLAVCESASLGDASLILPVAFAAHLPKIFKGVPRVTVSTASRFDGRPFGNAVVFESEGKGATTRTIEGTYPNYRQIIPTTFSHETAIPRDALASVCKAAVKLDSAKVRLGPEVVVKYYPKDDWGQSHQAVEDVQPVTLDYSGPTKYFDPIRLKKVLDSFPKGTGTVTMRFNDGPHASAVFTATTAPSYRVVLMPMHIPGEK